VSGRAPGGRGPLVLLVDRSGRGHAYADLFTRTHSDLTVFYAPGCPAITHPRIVSVPEVALDQPLPMVELARREGVEYVFVANAVALTGGFVDVFREHGIPVIGPGRAAAREYVRSVPWPVVVKADGLCGGNGSTVCDDADDAVRAIDRLMVEREFGQAGDRVVVERRLYGREVSFFVLLDGAGGHALLPMAADYPKSDDGNTGMTCGGMGAVSPHPLETPALVEEFRTRLLAPIQALIAGEGLRYTGILYAGAMLTDEGLYLLEINVRLGDPEAEAVLPRVEGDFHEACRAVLERRLGTDALPASPGHTCVVTLAQGRTRQVSHGRNKGWYTGWPYGRYGKGYPITVDPVDPARCRVFLGEAAVHPEKGLVSDGGRVAHVVGFGATRAEAAAAAYAHVGQVRFQGVRYRTDIGRVLPWSEPARAAAAATAP
jgi:phosphoribosylamine--glycine ligase